MTDVGAWRTVEAISSYRDLNAGLVELVGVPDRGIVLDVGCGTGAISTIVLDRAPTARVWAVDPSSEMLDAIPPSLRARITCRRESAENLTAVFPPDFADRIFMANCVHLLSDRHRSFVAANLSLREGGWLAISTAFSTIAREGTNAHLYRELAFAAMAKLKKKVPGVRPSRERPGLARWLEVNQLMKTLSSTGFSSINNVISQVSLDAEAIAGLIGSSYFARGVFPDVPPGLAAEVLREAALDVLKKNGLCRVSHRWLLLAARKVAE